MKKTVALSSWSRALALTSCLGVSGAAFAAASMEEMPQEQPPKEPVDDTLLVPESVVHVMELYASAEKDTAQGTELVRKYLDSLSEKERQVYVSYFEEQAQQALKAAEERFEWESKVDPEQAQKNYEEALSQIEGFDGDEPRQVPGFDEAQGKEAVRAKEEESSCSARVDSKGGTYEEICSGDSSDAERPRQDPFPPVPPATTCSSYKDRFGGTWERCNTSQVAYVYIHGAGKYDNYSEASHGYWGWNNLGGNVDGQDRFFVSWDATKSVQSQAGTVVGALDALCAPQRPCVLITHSAGGLMMGNILAQTNRWNILRVHATQSAAGGSELANLTLSSPILWIVNSLGLLQSIGGYPIYSLSLPVPIARGMYNHDVTRNVPFFTYASEKERSYRSCRWYQLGCHADNAWSSLVNGTMRGLYNGGSDWLVAYHSSSSFRSPNSRRAETACNPDSWTSWGGWGTPYYSASDRQNHYWTNYTSYHWQPQGQGFGCRKAFWGVEHSGRQISTSMPRPW